MSQNVSPISGGGSNNTFKDELFKINLKQFHNIMSSKEKDQNEMGGEKNEKVFYLLNLTHKLIIREKKSQNYMKKSQYSTKIWRKSKRKKIT